MWNTKFSTLIVSLSFSTLLPTALRIYTVFILWLLGYPDQALKRIYETLILARELSHPFSLAWALNSTARLHQCRGEVHAAQEQAEALLALATERGFPYWLAPGISLRGWALIEQGQVEEGLAQMRQSQSLGWITRTRRERPHYLALQVEVWRKVGRIKEGLAVLTDVIARVEKTGDRVYEAELYRLKGELLLAQARERITGTGQRERVTDP